MLDALMNFIGWLTVAAFTSCVAFWAVLTALDRPAADLAIVEKLAFLAGVLAFVAIAYFSPYPEVWFNE